MKYVVAKVSIDENRGGRITFLRSSAGTATAGTPRIDSTTRFYETREDAMCAMRENGYHSTIPVCVTSYYTIVCVEIKTGIAKSLGISSRGNTEWIDFGARKTGRFTEREKAEETLSTLSWNADTDAVSIFETTEYKVAVE